MIFYYQIGYYTEEESDFTVLMHTEEFSSQDISDMVKDAIVTLYSELFTMRRQRIPLVSLSFKDIYHGTLGDPTKNLISWLIDNKGFQPLNFTLKWHTFGWADVLDEKDWIDYRIQHRDPMLEVTQNLKKEPKMKQYVKKKQ